MTSNIMDKIHVRYINLDRRMDRLEQIKIYMNFLQFKPENIKRFSAINGIDIINDLTQKNLCDDKIFNVISEKPMNYSRGEIGCLLSHYFLLKEIMYDTSINDNDIVFIFEDDIFINNDYLSKTPFINILNELDEFTNKNTDWDLIYMGGRFESGYTQSHNDTFFFQNNRPFL